MSTRRNASARTVRARRPRRVLAGVTSVVAAAVVAACADAPTGSPAGPLARPRLEVVSPAVKANVLTRVAPLTGLHKAIAIIGSDGGTFSLPSVGLTVVVPAGAVKRPTTITVTAPEGPGVWYDFGPSGTTFALPLTVTQDLRGTNFNALPRTAKMEAGYFVDGTLDDLSGTALVQEFLPVTVSGTGTSLSFKVSHFSGYMVSWGRSASFE